MLQAARPALDDVLDAADDVRRALRHVHVVFVAERRHALLGDTLVAPRGDVLVPWLSWLNRGGDSTFI